jgi:hypothetical protein
LPKDQRLRHFLFLHLFYNGRMKRGLLLCLLDELSDLLDHLLATLLKTEGFRVLSAIGLPHRLVDLLSMRAAIFLLARDDLALILVVISTKISFVVVFVGSLVGLGLFQTLLFVFLIVG